MLRGILKDFLNSLKTIRCIPRARANCKTWYTMCQAADPFLTTALLSGVCSIVFDLIDVNPKTECWKPYLPDFPLHPSRPSVITQPPRSVSQNGKKRPREDAWASTSAFQRLPCHRTSYKEDGYSTFSIVIRIHSMRIPNPRMSKKHSKVATYDRKP